jgi:hypothetical protein
VTASFLLLVCVVSPAIFAASVWLTRAGGKRATGALAGGVVAALFSIAWDALAGRMDWWSYGAHGDWLATLALALSVAFVFGASAGLIGWRMMRAMSWTGVATFFAGYVGLGMLRDHLLASNTLVFVFGPGPMPQVMGAVGYLSLALAVQVTMLIMAGPPTRDELRAG